MSNIKNEDMDKNENEYMKLTEEEMEQVKGGPARRKFDHIQGESAVLGDGSVMPVPGGNAASKGRFER